MKRPALALAIALVIAQPAEAAPWVVDLSGTWQAQRAEGRPADAYKSGAPGPWTAMRLPGRWHERGMPTQGAVWFKRDFRVARGHRRAWLDLGGADYFTDAWLDGRHVGFHEGGSAPFRLPLGPVAAGRHALTLRVDSPIEPFGTVWSLHKRLLRGVANHHDTRPGGAWSPRGQDANSGGVWGGVQVRLTGDTAVAGVSVRPAVKGGKARLDLVVGLDHAGAAASGRLVATLAPIGFAGPAQRFSRRLTLHPGGRQVSWTLPVAEPRLWETWDRGGPARYRLTIAIEGAHGVSDTWARPVGLREVKRLPDGTWALNGRRIFLRGTNYISSPWPDDTDAAQLREDVAIMRRAHMNAVRVHAHVEPDAFYEACDEAGILVWQDLPLQWGYSDAPEVHRAAIRLATEVVAGYGHHPSIFAWCAHNEAPYSAEWMTYKYPDYFPHQNRDLDAKLVRALRAADPTRHAHPNSDTAEHPWLGWYSGSWLDYARPTTEPLITEFGAQALPNEATLRTIFPAWAIWPTTDKAWAIWDYHNFQKHETFAIAQVPQGPDLQTWIANSQAYQARLTAFAAERYRLQKYRPVGAIFQFQLLDPWPSVSWGALDHLRRPKAGYMAMARAYQPTLPVIDALPVQPAGHPLRVPVRVVHDGARSVERAQLIVKGPISQSQQWFHDNERVQQSVVRLPADGLSDPVMVEVEPLGAGAYRWELEVRDGNRVLGRNVTEWTVE